MGNFIVFEGLDGAGKSTLHRSFQKTNPEYVAMYSVPENLAEVRYIVDKAKNPLVALHFFGLCNVLRSKEIKDLLKIGKSVVVDRYIFTTLAYQYEMIGEKIMYWFDMIFSNNDIIIPDLVVFITARPEIIHDRIKHRSVPSNIVLEPEWYGDEISKTKSTTLKQSYMFFLNKIGVKWFEFDTSDYNIEEQIIALNEKIADVKK